MKPRVPPAKVGCFWDDCFDVERTVVRVSLTNPPSIEIVERIELTDFLSPLVTDEGSPP